MIIQIYWVLLIIYIFMSWVPSTRDTKFGQLLEKIAEPYLGFFRKFIPPLGMIDISPIVGLFTLNLISRGVEELFILLSKYLL
ncbi:YggT family protein [Sporosarcina limicola]|uniref:YggT family protein n=1 Tax=Sporosarcina limicola TaxID=34101 RepID=A0A927MGN7_9BACL|nr:YggT family protein [Sporosarcina limicola]MBE1553543.1 YggT family protein [Sporosarcina limicola]